MPEIKIAENWSYRTPQTTIDYPAGRWDVSDEVAAAYDRFINPPPPEELTDGDATDATDTTAESGATEEMTDGDGASETGEAGPPSTAEGRRNARSARTGDVDQS